LRSRILIEHDLSFSRTIFAAASLEYYVRPDTALARVNCKRPNLFMNVPETSGGKVRPADRLHAAVFRDPGEYRDVLLTIVVVALFVYFIRSILLPFVVAGVVAYICTPLLNWLTKVTRLPRSLLAILLFLLLVGSVALFVAVAGQRLIVETASTAADLQRTIERLVREAAGDQPIRVFGQSIDPGEIGRTVLDRIREWLDQPDRLTIIAGYSLATVMGIFLTAALLCYFLAGGPGIARGMLWMVPPSRRALVAQISTRLDPLLKRYFLGMLVIVIYAIAAAYLGLGVILGIGHAPLLAILTGILETVPIIGSTAAAIIAGLVSLHTAAGLTNVLAFAVYAIALRLSIDQIVAPLVLGSAAHVHPVLIIFCFFAGAVLLGIPGVILAVPVALAAKVTLATLYDDEVE
jgi:predicted PurR-regulated permease PerM